jgi:hypothetical protein
MRNTLEKHFQRSLAHVLIGVSLLGMFQTSCSRKDSSGTTAKISPASTTNPPAISNSVPDTNRLENPTPKGIAGVETVNVVKRADVPAPYHQVFVLCVGINSNPAYPQLRYAVSDASVVAGTLRNVYGFTNVTLLTNTMATRSNVLASLEEIRGRLSPTVKDDFIFYFSGHGDTWGEPLMQNGQTNGSRHGFLVAYNEATNLPANLAEYQERNLEITALASNIVGMPARHRLMFFDSCFSGFAYIKQDVVDKRPDDFDPAIIEHPTVQIMTAGTASEQAMEAPREEHGVFTAALLNQLTNDNILTMEEIFFPLRVAVRKSLRQMGGNHIMNPQLRYLISRNGTFLFVPLDQLPVWASAKSDNAGMADADAKGYLRPLTLAEATNVQSAAAASPDERDAQMDRYETRAAMGDPCATIALAQIYKGDAGVPPDPDRAKIYTAESSDFIIAGNNPALAGITNEVLQAIVGGLLKSYNPNDLFHFRGTGLVGNLAAETGTKITQSGLAAIVKRTTGWTTGLFAKSPIKELASRQKKVKSLLAHPTGKNIATAKKELRSCEDDLNKLSAQWPSDQQPAEFGQLRKLVQETETDLDQNRPDRAGTSIDNFAPVIESLQKIMKNQTGGN